MIAPDGTLNLPAGFSGALDVAGWAVTTTPDGRPRFVREDAQLQAALGDASNWDDRFGNNGANGSVYALAVISGDLYVGGDFNTIGQISANRVARYSPSTGTWSSLGFGLNNTVRAFASITSTLFIGGSFTGECGDAFCNTSVSANGVNNIVAWNGSAFVPLNNGVNAQVNALLTDGNTLYLGGSFVTPCVSTDCLSVPPAFGFNRIGTWHPITSTFEAVGFGIGTDATGSDYVNALSKVGSTIYVGGVFTTTCLNAGCGSFGGPGANNLAAWNGSSYTPLDDGLNGEVHTLAVSGSRLYIGGNFVRSCGSPDCTVQDPANGLNRIAYYEGSGFQALNNGLPSTVYSLAMSGTTVIAGGGFTHQCSNLDCSSTDTLTGIHNLAAWSGTPSDPFAAIGNGLNETVQAIATSGATTYLGGSFTARCTNTACTTTDFAMPLMNIAAVTGSVFSDLSNGKANGGVFAGSGATGTVNAIAMMNGDIYIGGDFRRVGNLQANYIARYSPATNTWTTLGNGVNNIVYTLAVSGTTLYLGGRFDLLCANTSCSTTQAANGVNGIAAWNGSSYSSLRNGLGGFVRTLYVDGTKLYIGGEFQTVCDESAPSCTVVVEDGSNHVTIWDGVVFSPIGFGVGSNVFAITKQGSTFYFGGSFSTLCSNAACNSTSPTSHAIVAHNGTSFQAMQQGVNGPVRSLAVYSNTLYLGGQFTRLCLDSVCNPAAAAGHNYFTSWTGSSFNPVGFGLVGVPLSMVVHDNKLYLGGGFNGTCGDVDCNTAVNATTLNNIAMFDGSAFSPINTGLNRSLLTGGSVNNLVFASSAAGSDLYIVGDFSANGRGASHGIARWGELANLAVSVIESAQHVAPGSPISYTVFVTNTGPATAMNAALNITLPSLATYGSVSPGTCTGSGPLACPLGYLAPNASSTAIVSMTAGSTLGAAVLTGTVSSSQVDTATGNNTDIATVNISGADLAINTFNVPSTLDQPGSTLATIQITNNGPLSSNVTATFTVSNLVVTNITTPIGSCTGATCSLGTMANGASALLILSLNAPAPGSASITATLTGSVVDPGNGPPFGYNTSTQTMTVGVPTQPADLQIGILAPANTSRSGPFTHVLTVTNAGPGPSLATVAITFTNLSLVSATPSQGTCSGTNCSLGTLASGQTVTVHVTTTGNTVGAASIAAVVTGAVTDPQPLNNSVSRSFSITRSITAISAALVGLSPTG